MYTHAYLPQTQSYRFTEDSKLVPSYSTSCGHHSHGCELFITCFTCTRTGARYSLQIAEVCKTSQSRFQTAFPIDSIVCTCTVLSMLFRTRRENSLSTRLGQAVYLNVALVLRHFVWPRVITQHKNRKNKSSTQKQANSCHLSLHNFCSSTPAGGSKVTFEPRDLRSVHTCVPPHIQRTM